MYEIWLGLNIVFELALTVLPWLLGALAVWIALVAAALLRGRARWRSTLPASVMMGATIAALGLWFVPLMTKSSIYEMGYWVDWANLIGLSLAVGGVAFAFVWPLLATVACPDGAAPSCGASR
jgi:NO-binding membrane sensor protein with MHYT domain